MGPFKVIASLFTAAATGSTFYSENPIPAVSSATQDISVTAIFSTTIVKGPATEPSVVTYFPGTSDSVMTTKVSSSVSSILPPSGSNLPSVSMTTIISQMPWPTDITIQTSIMTNHTITVPVDSDTAVPVNVTLTSTAVVPSSNVSTIVSTKIMSHASSAASASGSATSSAGPRNAGNKISEAGVMGFLAGGVLFVAGVFA